MVKTKRYHAIVLLLFVSSFTVAQILVISTAPIHEFGHYIIAKQFGWNITEVDWFSYVEMSEETIDNAPLAERVLVSSAGMILTLIIPYIIFQRIKNRSATIKLVFSFYLILEFTASAGDIKHLCSHIFRYLTGISVSTAEFKIGSSINIISSISAVIIVVFVTMRAMTRYSDYLIDVSTTIENMDSDQEGIQDEK